MTSIEWKRKKEAIETASMTHLHPPCYRVTQHVIEDPVDVKNFLEEREQIPINNYYKAKYAQIPKYVGDPSRKQLKKDIQYCNGLSNYSNVLLGDERVQFDLSLSQEVYKRAHASIRKAIQKEAPPPMTEEERRKLLIEYDEAINRVGRKTISEIETQMRLKLNQRTKTGPFQLRNTFKYFDRDGSGGINFEEFKLVFDLLGLSFSELQQLAVFGSYDKSADGEISYHEFIGELMEKDFTHVNSFFVLDDFLAKANDKTVLVTQKFKEQKRQEMLRTFTLIDKDRSGSINVQELEIFMLALGSVSKDLVKEAMKEIDKDNSGSIDFNEFFTWWFDKQNYKVQSNNDTKK